MAPPGVSAKPPERASLQEFVRNAVPNLVEAFCEIEETLLLPELNSSSEGVKHLAKCLTRWISKNDAIGHDYEGQPELSIRNENTQHLLGKLMKDNNRRYVTISAAARKRPNRETFELFCKLGV
jgi:hypothetical protein